jgi:pyruvate dehydrogenase E2 component (dihydrolipoamide acetyltransferase)
MVRTIVVPKLGQTEEQATIVRWVKNEGDVIAQGDVLFEIETDKALLEVESFFDGTLLKISVPEGQAVPIQSVVGFIGDPGDPIPEIVAPPALPQKTEAAHALAEAPTVLTGARRRTGQGANGEAAAARA